MTGPVGGEHISRYRAIGEFDNLIRAAKEAKRALKELREEEAKLNSQSLEDDKKIAASKQNRARAEQESAASAKRAVHDLNKEDIAGKSGEAAGVSYSRNVGKGIEKQSQSSENKRFLEAATNALSSAFTKAGDDSGKSFSRSFTSRYTGEQNGTERVIEDSVKKIQNAFSKAGDDSGKQFTLSVRERFRRDKDGIAKSSGFEYSLREFINISRRAGEDSGSQYILGFGDKIKRLNEILPLVGQDKLDLDVDIDDAQQAIAAIKIELNELSHTTADPRVRIDVNRAMTELRGLEKLFKDEVAEEIIKDSARIRKELEKLDSLPSGKSFKFWGLTALADMSRVFEQADKGTSVFNRLRQAAAGGGGGGNFIRSFISGFDDFSQSSSNLLQKLSRVSGELYRMPGLIGVLVASIPALISGLGALGGGALGLASGLGAVGGVLLAIPGLAAAGVASIGALSSAFSGFGDVLKLAKKARTEQAEADEKSRLGTDKALTSTQKLALRLKDLAPATSKATTAVIDFADAWLDTSDKVQEDFFKEVSGSIGNLNKVLPIAEKFLGSAATALGKVANDGLKMVTSGPFAKDFETIGKNNATVIDNLGHAALNVVSAFRHIAIAAASFTSWLTKGIRNAADAFDDWSKSARNSGGIEAFLGETQESLQSLWQIIKNLSGVVSSFFKSTVDEGQSYLRTLEGITGHWKDVAKAQEDANSPLRTWMVQIRPILSSLGALIGDVARGIGGLASNQNSISSMINLLDTLRTDVLPPIFSILQHLNDSGIAVTIVEAIGTLLEAIATFLDSGATTALTVFVTILANFAEILFKIASLPGVSDVLGAVASGLAAIAAVSVVARFTGLFKLWDFFNWMSRNRGNLAGAFTDAARGVAGLSSTGQQNLPTSIPSTISLGSNAVGSEAISGQAKAIDKVGESAKSASGKIGIFSRALSGISAAGGFAKGALSGLVGFLGGPWGIAITAATIGIGLLANHLADQKKEAQDTKDAFIALKGAYAELKGGDTSGVLNLAETDEKLKSIIDSANKYKISLTDVSGALNGQDQSLSRVNAQLDTQIKLLQNQAAAGAGKVTFQNGNLVLGEEYRDLARKAQEYKDQINEVANAQKGTNSAINEATNYTKTYQERLAGLTQTQVDTAVKVGEMDGQIRTLSNALDTLASATSTSSDKSKAWSDLINYQTNSATNANEATENFNSTLLDFTETVESNRDSVGKHGNALDVNTRAGLRNRDALEAAAKATRDLFLQDIAAGTPMDEVTRKHQQRIDKLKEEAKRLGLNKAETEKLIKTYGDVPDNIKTDIKTDEKGFAAVYAELLKLQTIQTALKEGKSVTEAEKDWRNKSNGLYQRPPSTGDGYGMAPGFATGGAVWGAGSKTSDSIQAWLSNGEFVQPADTVDHYGLSVMEALRSRKLDRGVLEEALPDTNRGGFASGGQVHGANCQACAGGGHKFAGGGQLTVPIEVDPSKTMIKDSWKYNGTDGAYLGGAGVGGSGWKWQMAVLRKAFPGLALLSGPRPGAVTLSGNRSYHSVGRAVDVPARRDVAQWVNTNYGSKTKELITPWNDLNIHNGKRHTYTGDIYAQHAGTGRFKGNAHDHWAFRDGGLVDLLDMLNVSNMMPNQNMKMPTAPRTLSPAASSVVNNSSESATNFGDIIINNPVPERGGDSIRDSLFRTRYLVG